MDIIIYNAKVLRADFSFSEAVAIEGNRIAKVGTNDEVLATKTEKTKIIDAQGQMVMPGFNDSHQHVYNMGTFLTNANLYGADSIDKVVEIGRAYIEEHQVPPGTILMGWGWNQDYFTDEKRLLNRHDLDRISTEHPIIFRRACGHVLGANTLAIELAGITKDTPQRDDGVFEVEADGTPSGVFNENAQDMLTCIEPELSVEYIKEKIMSSAEYAVSVGITTVQTNDLNSTSVEYPYMEQAYRELADEGKLPFRAYMQCCIMDPVEFKRYIDAGNYTGRGEGLYRTGPLKLFVDGSLGARTALMRKPYYDDNTTTGVEVLTQAQIDELVTLAQANNFSVAAHAIGDESINRMLTAYEKVYDPAKGNFLRHGIIHCQITDMELLERFKASDVMAYVQPIFIHYDMHIVEDRVGKDLAKTSYAWNTMDKLGIQTSYGSDAPVEDLDPFNNLYCAVTRKDLKGFPEGGYNPDECVTIEKAIERYTVGSAYMEFMEDEKGVLEEGKLADVIMLDQNLLEIPSDNIKDVKTVMTISDGRIVFER